MVEITAKRNQIYHINKKGDLKKYAVYQEKKLKIAEAARVLRENKIPFSELVKVVMEDYKIVIPQDELKKYIVK